MRLFVSSAAPIKNAIRIHYHSAVEISLILSGTGTYQTNNSTYSIHAGDIFFYRPNEPHCITNIEEPSMQLLNLHIAPYYIYTNFTKALSSEYIKILSAQLPIKSNKINDMLTEEKANELCALIRNIRSEFEQKQADFTTLVDNYISTILITISRATGDNSTSSHTTANAQNYQRLINVITYIDSNYKQDLTLKKIAAHIGYSRCYLSSVFKKCMGMSIWDYINIKRIEEALTLIKTTDKTILQIATESGFNNTANFNKIFKKYTNLPPKSFRK